MAICNTNGNLFKRFLWNLCCCFLLAGCGMGNLPTSPAAVVTSERHAPTYTFSTQRIDMPWWGPIVDSTGRTSPLQVGDADRDGDNELLVNLPVLDSGLSVEGDAALLAPRRTGVIKLLEWDMAQADYTLEKLVPMPLQPYEHGVSRTSPMHIVDEGMSANLLIGLSPWRSNTYGNLAIVDIMQDQEQSLLWESICLGGVYRLDSVQIAGEEVVFASTRSNYGLFPNQTSLQACENYTDIAQAEGISRTLVMITSEDTSFAYRIFPAGLNDTLLIENLPTPEGALYYLATDWTPDTAFHTTVAYTDTVSITTQIWQDDKFMPVSDFLQYAGAYLLQIEPLDLDGDGVLELAVLWGRDAADYHISGRENYDLLGDIHLDVYVWEGETYHQRWRHQFEQPVWRFVAGDLDNDGDAEVLTYAGAIVDWRQETGVLNSQLRTYLDQSGLADSQDQRDVQFLIADVDNDQQNEIILLARARAIPEDVSARIYQEFHEMPPEGVFYIHSINVQNNAATAQ